jgi:hypothetical protein
MATVQPLDVEAQIQQRANNTSLPKEICTAFYLFMILVAFLFLIWVVPYVFDAYLVHWLIGLMIPVSLIAPC